MVGYPGTDEVQHQFLGLVTKKLPNGAKNPAYDDLEVNGTPDHRVKQREEYIREAYEGSDATMRLAQKYMRRPRPEHVRRPPTTASRRSSRRSTPARCSSTSACCPSRRPATAARRPARRSARRRPAGPAARCRSTSTSRAATRRRSRRARSSRSRRPRRRHGRQDQDAFMALKDPNDWTGDGKPEGWKVIDRTYTKAEARYIPNGAKTHGRHVAPDAHGRPRGVLLPAVPVRRRDAGHADRALAVLRPARLRAGRAGPASQHEHARDVPGRRPGDRARRGRRRAQHRPRADRSRSCSASRSRSRARASCAATCSRTAAATRRSRSSG